jgi:hypothetical protein
LLALEGGDLRAQNPSYDPVGVKDDPSTTNRRDSFAVTSHFPTKPPLSLNGSALGGIQPFGDTARSLQPVTPLGLSLGDWITTSGNRAGISKPEPALNALDREEICPWKCRDSAVKCVLCGCVGTLQWSTLERAGFAGARLASLPKSEYPCSKSEAILSTTCSENPKREAVCVCWYDCCCMCCDVGAGFFNKQLPGRQSRCYCERLLRA